MRKHIVIPSDSNVLMKKTQVILHDTDIHAHYITMQTPTAGI